MKQYAFFPGCTISTRFPHFESTTMKVLKKLDVELKHIKDWTCCPEPLSIHMVNSESWYAIAARNICLAEEMGLDMLTVCSGCNSTLFRVNEELKKDTQLRTKVNGYLQKIGKQFRGTITIKSILRALYQDIGEEEIKRHITKPLHNIKVAVHYGCHIFDELKEYEDNAQDPQSVQKLVKALGAEIVDYPSKMLCCSGFARNINEEITFMNIEEKLIDLTTVKADCLVLMCPNCFLQYDLGQVSIRQKFKRIYKIPIIYLTQLLGLAIGFNAQEMGLNFHRSPTDSLIKKIEGIPVLGIS